MLAGRELQVRCFVATALQVLQGRSIISGKTQVSDFNSPCLFINFIFVTILK